jgi:hypothetical protein
LERTGARIQIAANIEHYKTRIEALERALHKSIEEQEVQKAMLERVLEGASSYCAERVPNNEIKYSTETIRQKIGILRKQIEEMQKQYGSPFTVAKDRAGMTEEAVNQKFMEIHNQLKTARDEMRELEDEHQVIPSFFGANLSVFAIHIVCVESDGSISERESLSKRNPILLICSPVVVTRANLSSITKLRRLKSRLILLETKAPPAKIQNRSLVERNLLLRSACYCLCGRQWVRQFEHWMNCMYTPRAR